MLTTASVSSLVNSQARRSHFSLLVAAPTISTIIAKIGTPSTKAANIRWTCNVKTALLSGLLALLPHRRRTSASVATGALSRRTGAVCDGSRTRRRLGQMGGSRGAQLERAVRFNPGVPKRVVSWRVSRATGFRGNRSASGADHRSAETPGSAAYQRWELNTHQTPSDAKRIPPVHQRTTAKRSAAPRLFAS